jgi:hypothetical protein
MSDVTTDIVDVDLTGELDAQGKIPYHTGPDALTNAIKMWVASFKGDILDHPSKGGYVTSLLMKPMNQVSVEVLTESILNGLENDFSPPLQILDLQIDPDYKNRTWKFYLSVFSPDLRMGSVVNEEIQGV